MGSHLDCTIFRTTRALSREHDNLKTLGAGPGISDKIHMTITYANIHKTYVELDSVKTQDFDRGLSSQM